MARIKTTLLYKQLHYKVTNNKALLTEKHSAEIVFLIQNIKIHLIIYDKKI